MERENGEPEQTFTMPLLGMFYGSLVVVLLVAFLNSRWAQSLDNEVAAPARTLIAAPVIIAGVVVFGACMVALLAPVYRRPAMRIAEIVAWLIPAWLVMGAMVLGAISFALHHAG